jgi:type VI secretion system protein ImpC
MKEMSLLEKILIYGRLVRDESQVGFAYSLLSNLVSQLMDKKKMDKRVLSFIYERIQEIDDILEERVNKILHHEDFKKLESSWRGLYYFVMNTQTSAQLRIRVLDISKKELFYDLTRFPEFDQSEIFKKIYEEE